MADPGALAPSDVPPPRPLALSDAERALLATGLTALYDTSPGLRPQILALLRRVEAPPEATSADREAERATRMHCALICATQAAMLDKGGDPEGAGGARLCATVLQALTPTGGAGR